MNYSHVLLGLLSSIWKGFVVFFFRWLVNILKPGYFITSLEKQNLKNRSSSNIALHPHKVAGSPVFPPNSYWALSTVGAEGTVRTASGLKELGLVGDRLGR